MPSKPTDTCSSSFAKSCTDFFGSNYKDHHITRFFSSWKARDNVFKLGVVGFEIASHIVDLTDASVDLKKGFHSATRGVKDARVVFGLINVLEGTVPTLYNQAKKIGEYISKLWKGDDMSVNLKTGEATKCLTCNHARPGKKTAQFTAENHTPERLLTLGNEMCNFAGSVTFTVAFGVCRPIIFAENHFKERVSASARSLGAKFGILMMVNHIAGFVGAILALVRDGIYYLKSRYDEEAMKVFFESVVRNMLMIFEKICELTVSVIAVFRLHAPAALRLTFALAAALLGIYRIWEETAA